MLRSSRLKAWDKIDDEVKLSAIGVLALDEQGKVKTQKARVAVDPRRVPELALLLALITPLGLGVVLAGAGFGALHHKGLGLKGEDRDRIGGRAWPEGKAAVGVPGQGRAGGDRLREARRAWRGPRRRTRSPPRSRPRSMRPRLRSKPRWPPQA